MSDAFPMRALDKVDVRLSLKATISVRIDRLAREAGLSRAAAISSMLEKSLDEHGIGLTASDKRKVNAIIKSNSEKRAAKVAALRGGAR